jgi:predicted O-methyltransferase YrrM
MPFASASVATDRPAQHARRLSSRLAQSAGAAVHTSADGRTTAELPAGSCVIVPHGSWLEVNVAASDVTALAALEGAVGEHLTADTEPGDGDIAELRVEWSAPATADDAFEPLHPVMADYVLAHSTASDELLDELAVETRLEAGDAAGMQISHDEGTLLTMLVRLVGARNAVEVGTFTGYSSICIARGLADGGRLLACDVSERWTAIARRYWERAGVADRIELKIAPALETLRALPVDETIDFAFIDADKESYPAYYEELVTRLRPGGVIVLDNVLRGGRVADPAMWRGQIVTMRRLNAEVAADERVDAVMLPLRDGVTVVRKR